MEFIVDLGRLAVMFLCSDFVLIFTLMRGLPAGWIRAEEVRAKGKDSGDQVSVSKNLLSLSFQLSGEVQIFSSRIKKRTLTNLQ